MEIEEVSIHARPVGRSCGCRVLPECDIIVQPRLAGETLRRLDNEKLILVEVLPTCWKRIAKYHRKDCEGFNPCNDIFDFNNPLLGTCHHQLTF